MLENGRRGIVRQCIPLEFALEADFQALRAHVFTASDVKNEQCAEYGYLVIEIESTLDAIDSALEAARYARPRLLILLSVLSFLSNYSFTIYQIVSSSYRFGDQSTSQDVEVSTFVVRGQDKSSDLLSLLRVVCSEAVGDRRLVASLLDRWRKAFYLQVESEAQLFDDEALLAYFHTLELLGGHYQKRLCDEGEREIQEFLADFLESTLKFRGDHLAQKQREKFKQVRVLLLADEQISAFSKICYFLDKIGMLDPRTQALVADLVRARNAIAHGRQVYQEEYVWPLPPFFLLDRDSDQHIPEVKVLSARAIATHIGLDAWREEWELVHSYLHPPPDIVKAFVSEGQFRRISVDQFLGGACEGVRPSSITDLFLSRKLRLQRLEESLRSILLEIEPSENNVGELFTAAVFLADSQDQELAERCRFIVKESWSHNWLGLLNVKDLLRYLEYRGFKPQWLRDWIERKGHVQEHRQGQIE